jgi:prepilin-type N-terminal cleavage/methylation domain-containing protein/prepilin-type processing-associated H-X9-DG protein
MMKFYKKSGFTLIELLVVIAIIAVLAAILFPVFAQAREKARETVCVSNARQIGLQVRMYAQDYDETMPIFYAYNVNPPAGVAGHKGVELEILPYGKNQDLFRCPDDSGGPAQVSADGGCPGTSSYWQCYGSSYRFDHGSFSTVAGESLQNGGSSFATNYTATVMVTDAMFTSPSETRIIRDEMFPFFIDPVYGYTPGYYQQWHPRGGGVIFADGHAKFVVSSSQFDQEVVCPSGGKSGDIDPASGQQYYWECD